MICFRPRSTIFFTLKAVANRNFKELQPSLFTSKKMSTAEHLGKTPNRLINERSPYLLQHAYNPVQWYPWGEEAFQKARDESKLIFLSVGYSTCHWCHVMEKESFENEEIAAVLNNDFIPIKVDREERPDVDRVYMTFVQATSGHGGWPMSVWLTPSLKPYIGGTYFPPDDSLFRRGFKSILKLISEKWKENQDGCNASADKIMDSIQRAMDVKTDSSCSIPSIDSCHKCVDQMIERFDEDLGGFGGAPKFPQPVNFDFLLKYHVSNRDSEKGKTALKMAVKTLKCMSNGGIHDHIGYGFHRYSTDQYWHVPHFEKMLYDQGQLAVSYADCYALTKDESLKDTLCKILEYVKRDLRHPSGGFYSAEDADSLASETESKKMEGAFYVWTHEQVREILNDEIVGNVSVADLLEQYYGITSTGNVSFDQDPHGELRGKNVLIIRSTIDDIATKMALSSQQVTDALERARQKLMTVREKRPRPHLDNKMITAWNALMISGYCRGAAVTGNPQYKEIALAAANFIKTHLYLDQSGILLRSCYCGASGNIEQIEPVIKGFDADYAYTIQAFLDVYEVTHDDQWIKCAAKLQETQTSLFWDCENGGFFSAAPGDDSILLRMKEDQDGAEPSANSVSSSNLMRLSAYLNNKQLTEQCEKLFKAFSDRIIKTPFALPSMAASLLWFWKGYKQIIVAGDPSNEETQKLVKCINETYLPFKIFIPPALKRDSYLYHQLADKLSIMLSTEDGAAKVFVCENFTCQMPVSKVDELKSLL